MENKKSNLSSFVAKLDAEILGDNEAVLLNGGFSSPSDSETNIGCNSICEMGVYAYPAILDNLRYMCYADKRNTIVVNSDGRIFKCTAVDFESTNGESHISTPHLEEDLKRNFQLIQKKRFSNKRCLDCEIFPLCLGGCLKIVKYNEEKDYCIYDNDSDLKKRLVMTIIKDRIRRNVIPDYNK